MHFQPRRPRHALTLRQRRSEVVGILSAALARMPLAAPVPYVSDAKNSPEFSQKALEVSRDTGFQWERNGGMQVGMVPAVHSTDWSVDDDSVEQQHPRNALLRLRHLQGRLRTCDSAGQGGRRESLGMAWPRVGHRRPNGRRFDICRGATPNHALARQEGLGIGIGLSTGDGKTVPEVYVTHHDAAA